MFDPEPQRRPKPEIEVIVVNPDAEPSDELLTALLALLRRSAAQTPE